MYTPACAETVYMYTPACAETVYMHTPTFAETVYELTLLPNNAANEIFLLK
jgi:hypothetical protein